MGCVGTQSLAECVATQSFAQRPGSACGRKQRPQTPISQATPIWTPARARFRCKFARVHACALVCSRLLLPPTGWRGLTHGRRSAGRTRSRRPLARCPVAARCLVALVALVAWGPFNLLVAADGAHHRQLPRTQTRQMTDTNGRQRLRATRHAWCAGQRGRGARMAAEGGNTLAAGGRRA